MNKDIPQPIIDMRQRIANKEPLTSLDALIITFVATQTALFAFHYLFGDKDAKCD